MGWFDDERERRRRGPVPPPVTPPPPGPPTPPPPVDGPPRSTAALPPAPPGWDSTKWADLNHQSIKYKIGRILAKYPPTVEGLKQALPELQMAFPGLTFDGKDSITIPGGKPVDVLRNASNGGDGWQWITSDDMGGAPPPGEHAATPGSYSELTGGGGGSFGGGSFGGGGGSFRMPRGSEYQFKGIPGFTPGYQSSSFGAPGATNAFTTGAPGVPPGTPPGMSGGGWNPGAPGSGITTQGPLDGGANTKSFTGEFGAGQLAADTSHAGGGASGAGGGYNRAPDFTPLNPFQPPEPPETFTDWNSTSFDVGQGAEQFKLPTGQEALNQDPGYQFRLSQGLEALQGSAAAKGLLRTGGTLKDIQEFGQRAGSQEYQNAVDRALSVAGFNETNRRAQLGLGLQANSQNNTFGLEGAKFNASNVQQNYENRYTGANQRYAYANQQNLAGNAQALGGYQTDVSRELAEKGIELTANQNAFMNSLNAQQQQFMQVFMLNGQSFDQAYKLLTARLQYA